MGRSVVIQTLFMDQLGFEKLGDEASPDICPCHAQNCRHRETIIEQSAPVLLLHLLRFTWNRHHQQPQKLQTRVRFDLVLPPIGNDSPYDLRAVVQHQGQHPRSTQSGHYTAYVRAHDFQWYHCDDSLQPRPCNLREVLDCQPYMLFYERR